MSEDVDSPEWRKGFEERERKREQEALEEKVEAKKTIKSLLRGGGVQASVGFALGYAGTKANNNFAAYSLIGIGSLEIAVGLTKTLAGGIYSSLMWWLERDEKKREKRLADWTESGGALKFVERMTGFPTSYASYHPQERDSLWIKWAYLAEPILTRAIEEHSDRLGGLECFHSLDTGCGEISYKLRRNSDGTFRIQSETPEGFEDFAEKWDNDGKNYSPDELAKKLLLADPERSFVKSLKERTGIDLKKEVTRRKIAEGKEALIGVKDSPYYTQEEGRRIMQVHKYGGVFRHDWFR